MSFTAHLDEAEYREWTRVPETPSASQTLPDQWVNWGDHTVQVDPIGNKQWIHDSHDGHARSEKRGRAYDSKDVQSLLGWEKTHEPVPLTYYTPSVTEIGGMHKLATTLQPDLWGGWDFDRLDKRKQLDRGCRTWRGAERDTSRIGKLPSISALLYDNQLAEKSTEEIEHEIREHDRTISARVYERDGVSR